MPYFSAYSSSKAAILRLTDTLALETKEYSISVFAISVGPARTEIMAHIMNSNAGQKWFPEGQTWLSKPEVWVPVERAGELVGFLASGKADVLSGRLFGSSDNEAELVRRAEEIQKGDLYTLRLRK
jgi:NAD(P)-dependent dehydrogenase (short-subunit alcohol dehydrogenase family)